MSRTPANITQADVARVIRAAQQCGAGSIKVKLPSGATIEIEPTPAPPAQDDRAGVAQKRRFVF
jgi:hypothetical protein